MSQLNYTQPVQPPYAREVIAARQAGEPMNVHVYVGASAWTRARYRAPGQRIVLPLDVNHCATDYDFTSLNGLSIVVNGADADLAQARQVAVRTVEHGAKLAVLLHPGLPKWTEFLYGEVA